MPTPSSKTGRPRLILYFDINNTIIIRDPAQNISSVQLNVALNICKMAWGKLIYEREGDKEKGKAPKWWQTCPVL